MFTPFVIIIPEKTLLYRAGFREMTGDEGETHRYESEPIKVVEIN